MTPTTPAPSQEYPQSKSTFQQVFGDLLKVEKKKEDVESQKSTPSKKNDVRRCYSGTNLKNSNVITTPAGAPSHLQVEDAFPCELPGKTDGLHYGHSQKHKDVSSKVCSKFPKESPTRKSLVHTRRHEKSIQKGPRIYQCKYCDDTFFHISMRESHHSIKHSSHAKLSCQFCDKIFNTRSDLRTHLATHLSVQSCICDVCGHSFNDISDLLRHLHLHSGNKPYPCDLCGKQFTRESTLKLHKIKHHDKQLITCPAIPHQCDKVFHTPLLTKQHADRSHPEILWDNTQLKLQDQKHEHSYSCRDSGEATSDCCKGLKFQREDHKTSVGETFKDLPETSFRLGVNNLQSHKHEPCMEQASPRKQYEVSHPVDTSLSTVCPALPQQCGKVFRFPLLARQHAYRSHPDIIWDDLLPQQHTFFSEGCGKTFYPRTKDLKKVKSNKKRSENVKSTFGELPLKTCSEIDVEKLNCHHLPRRDVEDTSQVGIEGQMDPGHLKSKLVCSCNTVMDVRNSPVVLVDKRIEVSTASGKTPLPPESVSKIGLDNMRWYFNKGPQLNREADQIPIGVINDFDRQMRPFESYDPFQNCVNNAMIDVNNSPVDLSNKSIVMPTSKELLLPVEAGSEIYDDNFNYWYKQTEEINDIDEQLGSARRDNHIALEDNCVNNAMVFLNNSPIDLSNKRKSTPGELLLGSDQSVCHLESEIDYENNDMINFNDSPLDLSNKQNYSLPSFGSLGADTSYGAAADDDAAAAIDDNNCPLDLSDRGQLTLEVGPGIHMDQFSSWQFNRHELQRPIGSVTAIDVNVLEALGPFGTYYYPEANMNFVGSTGMDVNSYPINLSATSELHHHTLAVDPNMYTDQFNHWQYDRLEFERSFNNVPMPRRSIEGFTQIEEPQSSFGNFYPSGAHTDYINNAMMVGSSCPMDLSLKRQSTLELDSDIYTKQCNPWQSNRLEPERSYDNVTLGDDNQFEEPQNSFITSPGDCTNSVGAVMVVNDSSIGLSRRRTPSELQQLTMDMDPNVYMDQFTPWLFNRFELQRPTEELSLVGSYQFETRQNAFGTYNEPRAHTEHLNDNSIIDFMSYPIDLSEKGKSTPKEQLLLREASPRIDTRQLDPWHFYQPQPHRADADFPLIDTHNTEESELLQYHRGAEAGYVSDDEIDVNNTPIDLSCERDMKPNLEGLLPPVETESDMDMDNFNGWYLNRPQLNKDIDKMSLHSNDDEENMESLENDFLVGTKSNFVYDASTDDNNSPLDLSNKRTSSAEMLLLPFERDSDTCVQHLTPLVNGSVTNCSVDELSLKGIKDIKDRMEALKIYEEAESNLVYTDHAGRDIYFPSKTKSKYSSGELLSPPQGISETSLDTVNEYNPEQDIAADESKIDQTSGEQHSPHCEEVHGNQLNDPTLGNIDLACVKLLDKNVSLIHESTEDKTLKPKQSKAEMETTNRYNPVTYESNSAADDHLESNEDSIKNVFKNLDTSSTVVPRKRDMKPTSGTKTTLEAIPEIYEDELHVYNDERPKANCLHSALKDADIFPANPTGSASLPAGVLLLPLETGSKIKVNQVTGCRILEPNSEEMAIPDTKDVAGPFSMIETDAQLIFEVNLVNSVAEDVNMPSIKLLVKSGNEDLDALSEGNIGRTEESAKDVSLCNYSNLKLENPSSDSKDCHTGKLVKSSVNLVPLKANHASEENVASSEAKFLGRETEFLHENDDHQYQSNLITEGVSKSSNSEVLNDIHEEEENKIKPLFASFGESYVALLKEIGISENDTDENEEDNVQDFIKPDDPHCSCTEPPKLSFDDNYTAMLKEIGIIEERDANCINDSEALSMENEQNNIQDEVVSSSQKHVQSENQFQTTEQSSLNERSKDQNPLFTMEFSEEVLSLLPESNEPEIIVMYVTQEDGTEVEVWIKPEMKTVPIDRIASDVKKCTPEEAMEEAHSSAATQTGSVLYGVGNIVPQLPVRESMPHSSRKEENVQSTFNGDIDSHTTELFGPTGLQKTVLETKFPHISESESSLIPLSQNEFESNAEENAVSSSVDIPRRTMLLSSRPDGLLSNALENIQDTVERPTSLLSGQDDMQSNLVENSVSLPEVVVERPSSIHEPVNLHLCGMEERTPQVTVNKPTCNFHSNMNETVLQAPVERPTILVQSLGKAAPEISVKETALVASELEEIESNILRFKKPSYLPPNDEPTSASLEPDQMLLNPRTIAKCWLLRSQRLKIDKKIVLQGSEALKKPSATGPKRECPECGKVFLKASNLNQHLGLHFSIVKCHKCTECDHSFSWKSSLNKHMVSVHGRVLEDLLCDLCGKRYKNIYEVKQHKIRDHQNLSPYKCEVCHKSYSRKYNLQIHQRVHVKPFKYNINSVRFNHSSHFCRHQRVKTQNHCAEVVEFAKKAVTTHEPILEIQEDTDGQAGGDIELVREEIAEGGIC